MSEKETKKPEVETAKAPDPINAQECAYLIQKLDCNIPLNGHQDRNMMAHCINRLQAIVDAAPAPPGATKQ